MEVRNRRESKAVTLDPAGGGREAEAHVVPRSFLSLPVPWESARREWEYALVPMTRPEVVWEIVLKTARGEGCSAEDTEARRSYE